MMDNTASVAMPTDKPTSGLPHKAYFITGTDTEIGKTLVSSTLVHILAKRGARVVGLKPVASGTCVRHGHVCNDDVEALKAQSSVRLADDVVNTYLMDAPTAPHIAAKDAHIHIDLQRIRASYETARKAADYVIVEGVGGFLVPLGDDIDTGDMARLLDLPVILVVGIRLGCINHALLTAQAIAAAGLPLAGWIANVVSPDMLHLQETITALKDRLAAPMLGSVPHMTTPSVEHAAVFLDAVF